MLVGLGLMLAGCGAVGDDTRTEPPAGDTTTTSLLTTTTTEDQMEDGIVQKAVRNLAARLDIPEEDINVVEVKDVQWPDGALGCPEEGKMYTQAVVDGTQVLLGAGERVYNYHASAHGEPFLCPSDEKDGGYEFLPPPGNP